MLFSLLFGPCKPVRSQYAKHLDRMILHFLEKPIPSQGTVFHWLHIYYFTVVPGSQSLKSEDYPSLDCSSFSLLYQKYSEVTGFLLNVREVLLHLRPALLGFYQLEVFVHHTLFLVSQLAVHIECRPTGYAKRQSIIQKWFQTEE